MFGFFKTFREAKATQRSLTEAFKARGQDFMMLNSVVHKAMVKEAIFESNNRTYGILEEKPGLKTFLDNVRSWPV
jgi:hypothetical protein